MKTFLIVVGITFTLTSTIVPAKALKSDILKCKLNSSDQKKYSQCLDIVKIKIDRELETWVNNQTFTLEEAANTTGRKAAYEIFKRSQNNFITYRENNCKWQFLSQLPSDGSANTYKECYILTSKDRIKELSRISK
jgi:uncharacterized protein YecT (DUF1311 family)